MRKTCLSRIWLPCLLISSILTVPLNAASPGYRVYVSNERSGDISVIDPVTNKVTATIAVGKRPRGINPSPDAKTLYVALSGSPIAGPGVDESTLPPADKKADGIGVIDLKTGRFVSKLISGSDPEQFSLSKNGRYMYIANEDVGQASVLDLSSGSIIATLPVGYEPEGVTTSPNGRWVYVTGESSNQVHVIDTATNTIAAEINTGQRPRSVAFTPDSAKAYVTCENDGTISVVDVATSAVVRHIALRRGTKDDLVRPMGIVLSPEGRRAFVTTGRGKSVVCLDTTTDTVVARLDDVGQRPWGIGVSPDGRWLYTANGPSNDVSVIDTKTMTLASRIPVGTSPWGIAIVATPVRDEER